MTSEKQNLSRLAKAQRSQRRRLKLRVIKFGGSLFASDQWLKWAETFWQELRPMLTIVVFGGGEAVDELRRQQNEINISDADAHFAAIGIMDENTQYVYKNWPRTLLCRSQLEYDFLINRLTELKAEREKFFIAPVFLDWWPELLEYSEAKEIPLPRESWSVTSDSLAAWLARVIEADELILLKSCTPESVGCDPNDLESWSKRGYVDEDFCTWAKEIKKVRAVNLKNA